MIRNKILSKNVLFLALASMAALAAGSANAGSVSAGGASAGPGGSVDQRAAMDKQAAQPQTAVVQFTNQRPNTCAQFVAVVFGRSVQTGKLGTMKWTRRNLPFDTPVTAYVYNGKCGGSGTVVESKTFRVPAHPAGVTYFTIKK